MGLWKGKRLGYIIGVCSRKGGKKERKAWKRRSVNNQDWEEEKEGKEKVVEIERFPDG